MIVAQRANQPSSRRSPTRSSATSSASRSPRTRSQRAALPPALREGSPTAFLPTEMPVDEERNGAKAGRHHVARPSRPSPSGRRGVAHQPSGGGLRLRRSANFRQVAFMSKSATRHSKLQVRVRDRQERPRGLSLPHGLSSRSRRLLQVPDDRSDHCRPPDVDSHAPAALLGYFARPPRALPLASRCPEVTASVVAAERALANPCRRSSSREGTGSSGCRPCRRAMDM